MSTVYLGAVAHLRGDPFVCENALEIIESGALWVGGDGRIIGCGPQSEILPRAGEAGIERHEGAWLIPGLVDGHIHFPQYYATAARGGQLLDWLTQSILPAETAYADPTFAANAARDFVNHLLRCGTTTALVFGSQFRHADRALFDAAKAAGLRLIAGMTLMDRPGPGVPEVLLQSVRTVRDHVESMIAFCREEPLLQYAVTPRYPLSCSQEMMEMCSDLLRVHPDTYLQTHINENLGEIAAVRSHFRDSRDYLDVYESCGLVTERTVLAHNIHASDGELERIANAGCSVCHCPSSNLYLGSGLFPLARHLNRGIALAVGTDVGAGTSFSIWRNLSYAYIIQQLQGMTLDAAQLLYLGTLGGARALRIDRETGNFASGKSADFFVLSARKDAYLSNRLLRCANPEERLFCMLHLASESQVEAAFVTGRRVYSCDSSGKSCS